MVLIRKASGNFEKFNEEKVRRTCLRAGVSKSEADQISKEIKKQIYEGIESKEILKKVIILLKKYKNQNSAIKYNLKKAIMELGPSGFPFEIYFSRILEEYGFKTRVGQIMRGKKVNQEVDVFAKKDNENYMIECKYHNQPGIYTDLKVAMYTYARFLDLKKFFNQSWLVTNTKCSIDAINYSEGVNQKITGWDYPKKENLRNLIELKKIYPITILEQVRGQIKRSLFELEILSIKDVLKQDLDNLSHQSGISKNVLSKILSGARSLNEDFKKK